MSESPSKLATLKEVAEYLNVHDNTVRNLVKQNSIPYVVVGGLYRFVMEDIKQYVKMKENSNTG